MFNETLQFYSLRRSGGHGYAGHSFRPMTLRLRLSTNLPLFGHLLFGLYAYPVPLTFTILQCQPHKKVRLLKIDIMRGGLTIMVLDL